MVGTVSRAAAARRGAGQARPRRPTHLDYANRELVY